MNRIIPPLYSVVQLARAFFKWFRETTIAPKSESGRLPPIRYEDPKDIYLA